MVMARLVMKKSETKAQKAARATPGEKGIVKNIEFYFFCVFLWKNLYTSVEGGTNDEE